MSIYKNTAGTNQILLTSGANAATPVSGVGTVFVDSQFNMGVKSSGAVVYYVGPPPGTVIWHISATVDGYLICAGGTLGKASSGATFASDSYETLFNIVKTMSPNTGSESFAAGNTVVLPDLRGRTIAGRDDMGGSAANLLTTGTGNFGSATTVGATGGVQSVTLSANQSGLRDHTHTYDDSTASLAAIRGTGASNAATSVSTVGRTTGSANIGGNSASANLY